MKVLIVAKTRQGGGACIGGITFEGRSVRLIAADAAVNEHVGLEYSIGDVWEVEAVAPHEVVPPHVENIVVQSKRRMGPMSSPERFIERHMPPLTGGVEQLYEGLAQVGLSGALHIAERSGVPPYSTIFWRPDQPLTRIEDNKRLRYRYPTPDGGRTLVFVGFQEPIAVIPAGALVRVSLAHWWRPDDRPDEEPRCYVQLSGYFLAPSTVMLRAAEASPVAAPEPRLFGGPQGDTMAAERPFGAFGQGDTNQAPADVMLRAAEAPPAVATEPRPFGGPQGDSVEVGPVRDSWSDSEFPPVPLSSPPLAHALLKSVFGYDEFWPLQGEIIENVLARRDTLAVMPTGGGKSLCYQLPALLFDGLTLVISPLIALMQDQVDQLRALGVPAAFLNSTLDYRSYVETMDAVRAGQVKLLYTSPETLVRPETLVLLDQSRLDCLAIDEAHCISQWGHDFRPEYRQLLPVRERYPQAVCLAFTATATERVRQDIAQQVGFTEANTFVASFNRANLHLASRPRTDGLGQVLGFLDGRRDQSGIIYCSTRETVDLLAARLAEAGWPALPYHAGLDDATRQRNQRQFVRADVAIMVATIAFGMGINKPNVRFVVHFNLPKDIESYYQEIGRAGRDGLPSDCLLLHARKDIATIQYFIEQGAPSQQAGATARLQAMLRYAQAHGCRRTPLLAYFGERFAGAPCGACDNCQREQAGGEKVDLTEPARKFLSCVKDTGQMFGVSHIANVLRGSQARKVLQHRHDRLAVHGSGREHSDRQWSRLGQQFIAAGLLEQDMEHGGLRLTAAGREVLAGSRRVLLAAPELPAAAPAPVPTYDAGLFQALRALRRELAEAANVPPYVVFSDRSLLEMATYCPQSPERLLDMDGVGQVKLERYGDAFLAVLRAYCAAHGLAERSKTPHAPMLSDGLAKRRFAEVGELFAAGHSVAQLQAQYGVQRSTIMGHLIRFNQEGGAVDSERVLAASALTPEQQARVLALFDELGAQYLNPVFEALGGTIPYEELHVMRVVYLARS
ncbi:MAG: DNA helicase RecQ [Anaerolineae bacterium]